VSNYACDTIVRHGVLSAEMAFVLAGDLGR
jgi:hypothetical protein